MVFFKLPPVAVPGDAEYAVRDLVGLERCLWTAPLANRPVRISQPGIVLPINDTVRLFGDDFVRCSGFFVEMEDTFKAGCQSAIPMPRQTENSKCCYANDPVRGWPNIYNLWEFFQRGTQAFLQPGWRCGLSAHACTA